MKKLLILSTAITMTACVAMAQITIDLPYNKLIGKNSAGKWETWPTKWEDPAKNGEFVPNLTIKKVDSDIFSVNIYFGGSSSGSLQSNVVYDPTQTAKIRKELSNDKLTAYRYTGSKDYIWTENITLAEIYSNKSNWTSKSNAKIYTWEYSLGSASVYTAKAPTASKPAIAASKKYVTNFKSTSKNIKGTWTSWSAWSTAPKNSYFELKVVTEGRVYNFKYFENGKMLKNYDITYDDKATQISKEKNSKMNCYKINGLKEGWVYLLNTTIRNVIANPDKWSNENDAVIQIFDGEKSGIATRIK